VRDVPTFRRVAGGALEVTLHTQEIELLEWVLGDLRRFVAAPSDDDAVTRRLYPRAYLDPTEEEAEQQWQGLVRDDLAASRVAAVDEVLTALTSAAHVSTTALVRITFRDEQDSQLLTVLNDARLALGTVAEVTQDLDVDALVLEPDDPRFQLIFVYGYMTEIFDELVNVMLDDLDDDPDHDTDH
jgi:hypothetical protein